METARGTEGVRHEGEPPTGGRARDEGEGEGVENEIDRDK